MMVINHFRPWNGESDQIKTSQGPSVEKYGRMMSSSIIERRCLVAAKSSTTQTKRHAEYLGNSYSK